jgi:hypothetical protein
LDVLSHVAFDGCLAAMVFDLVDPGAKMPKAAEFIGGLTRCFFIPAECRIHKFPSIHFGFAALFLWERCGFLALMSAIPCPETAGRNLVIPGLLPQKNPFLG